MYIFLITKLYIYKCEKYYYTTITFLKKNIIYSLIIFKKNYITVSLLFNVHLLIKKTICLFLSSSNKLLLNIY